MIVCMVTLRTTHDLKPKDRITYTHFHDGISGDASTETREIDPREDEALFEAPPMVLEDSPITRVVRGKRVIWDNGWTA